MLLFYLLGMSVRHAAQRKALSWTFTFKEYHKILFFVKFNKD